MPRPAGPTSPKRLTIEAAWHSSALRAKRPPPRSSSHTHRRSRSQPPFQPPPWPPAPQRMQPSIPTLLAIPSGRQCTTPSTRAPRPSDRPCPQRMHRQTAQPEPTDPSQERPSWVAAVHRLRLTARPCRAAPSSRWRMSHTRWPCCEGTRRENVANRLGVRSRTGHCDIGLRRGSGARQTCHMRSKSRAALQSAWAPASAAPTLQDGQSRKSDLCMHHLRGIACLRICRMAPILPAAA